MVQVNLVSNDGTKFPLDLEVARLAKVLNTMYDDLGDIQEGEDIPISEVRSEILDLVIKWMEYHKEDAPSFVYNEDDEGPFTISEWDKKFLKVDKDTVFQIMMAANYLEIPLLLEVCYKIMANIIDGCASTDELRREFQIENDLSPEEEAEIRRENQNCGHSD